jgi:tripartite-type tricarboxylate transporter receptor subunit TctC
LLDSVPPIADTVPGFDWSGWMAFSGPANLPAAIVTKIADEIRRLQGSALYKDLLNKAAMEPLDPLSPNDLAEFVKTEYRRWGPAIKASGATAD